MNRHYIFPLLFALIAALFPVSSPSLLAMDDEEELGERFDSIPLPEGLTKEDIRDVIGQVLANREWTVKQRTDRRVVGYLKHRGNEATATFLFDGDSIEIYCVGYAIDKNGTRKKPEQPKGWLNNLRRDLNRKLSGMSAAL